MLTYVKNIHGQVSLVAAEDLKKDQIVFDLDLGEFFELPTLRTIELEPKIMVDHPWGRYTNHSCNPSCYVLKSDRTMRALRDIKIGEEINFDYTKNESNISTSFQCKCGAKKCVGLIGSSNSTPTHL
jgi:hypothetical protein